MAATRLIPLHANKGRTVAQSLGDRTDYAKNPEKTEKGELVTAYACDPMTVDEEFLLQKREYAQFTGGTRRDGIIAYQIRQSFKPGEITPEEANRLGHELAMRFIKGRYAFIVATHGPGAYSQPHHFQFDGSGRDPEVQGFPSVRPGAAAAQQYGLSGAWRVGDRAEALPGMAETDCLPEKGNDPGTDLPGY